MLKEFCLFVACLPLGRIDRERQVLFKMAKNLLKHWSKISSQINKKNRILSSINRIIGYGGLIHNFKNYVIRGKARYEESTKNNINELFWMVYKLYTFYVIVFVIFLFLFIYKMFKYFNKSIKVESIKSKLITFPIILIFLVLGARSSVGSATPNQSFYTFSNSNIHNEIANNSIFSILYAMYLVKKEKNYIYGNLSGVESIDNIKNKYNILIDL